MHKVQCQLNQRLQFDITPQSLTIITCDDGSSLCSSIIVTLIDKLGIFSTSLWAAGGSTT